MTPTLNAALADLHALLDDTPLAAVNAVYDHEPGREVTGPVYVTIALERLVSTEQVWAVRIYSQLKDNPQHATTGLYDALDAVDDRLGTAGHVPSQWEIGVVDDIGCLVARCFVEVPRESF